MFNLTDQEIIQGFLETLRLKIIESQARKGIKASGKSADALRVEVDKTGTNGKIIDGSGTFYYQEYGRGPYKGGERGGLWQKIYDWLEYKKYGFNWANNKEREGMAFALTKKIQEYGTYTHFEGEPTGVLSEVITSEAIAPLVEQLKGKYLAKATSEVIKELKEWQ